jgi:hypothetical protein
VIRSNNRALPVEFIFTYRQNKVANFTLSVFVDINEHNRQLLGSVEVSGTVFYDASGNEHGMRHANIPGRLLRDSVNRNTINMP